MNIQDIKSKILSLFREKEILKDLEMEQDFFDLGVSSLAIVELQIVIENELQIEVPTSTLMVSSTVAEWVEVYTQKAREEKMLEPVVTAS